MRAHGLLRVLLVSAALLAACSSDEQRRADHVARADEFLAQGKSSEALIELRSALQLDPQNADLNFRIGETLEFSGALADALFFYQEALRLAPQENRAALAAARLLMFEEPDRAQELIAGVLARDPGEPLAYMRRSELALVRGNTVDALEDARTAVEKAPNSHMAHFQEGVVQRARVRERRLLGQDDDPKIFEEALAAFDEGLEVAGPEAPVREVVRGAIERALVFAAWKDHGAEAASAYRRAVEIARERASVPEELIALGETRNYGQAIGDVALERWALDAQIELEPRTYPAWARLAVITDDPSVPERLIETLPDDELAHAFYARILWARGNKDEAMAHLREVEGKLADPVPIRSLLVELLIESGRLDDARTIVVGLSQEHADRPETADVVSLLAMREARYTDAVEALKKLVERRDSAHAQLRLAEAQLRLGDTARALEAANRGITLVGEGADKLPLLRLKGRIEIVSGDNEAGISTFRLVRRTYGGISPDDVPILARAFYDTGRNDAARSFLADTLALDDPPLAATLLFLAQESGRDPAAAREALARAEARHPNQPALLAHRVRIDLAEGQPGRAEERLAAAVVANPKHAPLQRLQAQVLAANGKLQEALEVAERALKLAPEMPGIAELVVGLLTQLGDREKAIERLEKEAAGGKLGVEGRLLLARLQIVAGRDDRAAELLETVVAERSDLPGAKNDLAFLLAKKGADIERARRLAEEARAAMPRSPQVADTLGYVYLKKGLAEPAADQFRAAIGLADEQSPAWATFQYHLGLSYKALGRLPEAREAFERALATSVEFPDAAEARKEADGIPAAPDA